MKPMPECEHHVPFDTICGECAMRPGIDAELLRTLPISDSWLYLSARVRRTADGIFVDDLRVTASAGSSAG